MRRPHLPIIEHAAAPTIYVDELAAVERLGSVVRLVFTSPDIRRLEGPPVIDGRRLEVRLAVPVEAVADIAAVLTEALAACEITIREPTPAPVLRLVPKPPDTDA